jgi:hypothetical protein
MGHSKAAGNVVLAGAMFAAGIGVAAPTAQGQEPPTSAQSDQTPGPQAQWLGVPRHELLKKFGRPSQIIEYPDTGGQLLIYSHPGQPHYVFETGPDGKVIRAAKTK